MNSLGPGPEKDSHADLAFVRSLNETLGDSGEFGRRTAPPCRTNGTGGRASRESKSPVGESHLSLTMSVTYLIQEWLRPMSSFENTRFRT